MNTIFTKMLYELGNGRDMVLVTIISQKKSSPRGLGTQMLVKNDGSIIGSVGGGALEKHCMDLAVKCMKDKCSAIKDYTLRQNGTDSIGMVCGGDVSVFLQFVDAQKPEWNELAQKMISLFSAHQTGWLVMHLNGSVPTVLDESGRLLVGKPVGVIPNLLKKACQRTDSCFYMPLPVLDRAVLFGGGHCTQALLPCLTRIGFRVTIMDNRPAFADSALFSEAEKVICGDYGRISDYLTLTQSDYVIIMTDGHAYDLDIQKQVLQNPPYYVGVIGSRTKKAFVNAKLRDAGISDEVINSVHTPIGTDIKAVTPEEIAISIAGEMIYERAMLREACGITAHECPMH